MEADLESTPEPNKEHFLDDDINQGDYFARKVRELYEKDIASVLLVRGEKNTALVLVDDYNNTILGHQMNEMKANISQEIFKENIDIEFNMMLVSDFWAHFQQRNPQIFQILRSSYILYDIGFMRPIQELFVKGKIRPSKESRNVHFVKAEKGLKNSTVHINSAMIDIYWAVVDVAHAGVMMAGITPPSPKELAETLRKELIARNLIHKRCGDIIEKAYTTAKQILHKQKWEVSGKEFDKYVSDAEFFISEITDFVKKYHAKADKSAVR